MKFVLCPFAISLFFTSVFGQCGDELKPENSGELVKAVKVSVSEPGEFGLSVKARVPDGSWLKKGSEAAVLTVFVDSEYRLDIMLFAGAELFDYKALLGRLESGQHEVSIRVNRARSATNANRVIVANARIITLSGARKTDADSLAIQNAPFIYARTNVVDAFSDIPLVTYFEKLPEKDRAFGIRYTTIFSNEDGGTQTTALMARWGRATDIEWVYEVWFRDGKRIAETFQGANHVTTAFSGTRIFGEHPLITNVTVNNNFSDKGCSALRFSLVPIRADLAKGSRETVMDQNPWTYRIMAEETLREGRIDPANLGVNTIDDLRNYLYVEVYSENSGTAISVQVTTADGKTSHSDFNDERLRVARSGFQRIAVRLPSASPVLSVKLICHKIADRDAESCGESQLSHYVRLNKTFFPQRVSPRKAIRRKIGPGEFIEWRVARNSRMK